MTGGGKQHTQRVMHSSDRSDWCTPDPLYLKLHGELRFTCDLAADAKHAKCARFFGPGSAVCEDALHSDCRWTGRGFLNPPYSQKLVAAYTSGKIRVGKGTAAKTVDHPIDLVKASHYRIESWLAKALRESREGWRGAVVIPFSPQTLWYRRFVYGHVIEPVTSSDGTYRAPRHGWTCFFCGETFRAEQAASEHFGEHPNGNRWMGHAALEERKITHRVTFLRPDGTVENSAPGNTAVIIYGPNPGYVGPWEPASRYWSYR